MNQKLSIPSLLESIGPARRDNRERVAAIFFEKPEMLPDLMVFVFNTNYKLHYKAAWILEILLEKDLNILLPHIDFFTSNIGKLRHESAVRPIAKICNWLAISYVKKQAEDLLKSLSITNIEQIVETGFDWMIGNFKVATKAYTMNSLFYFGKLKTPEFLWIHKELKNTILQKINNSSSAFKARGRITLELIAKEDIK